MTSGYPDWLRAFLLLGKYSTTYLPVLLDASGNLYAVFKGDKGAGVLANVAVDASGQLIMVPRGQSGVYMAVDADGYLTTVIKGEYEGALRTVKLDDEGRLSAYVVDSIDAWSQLLNVGNAELAARLGSIVRLDRRGVVMFLDNFDTGSSRWYISTGGTGTAHALTPQYSCSGGYSLRLTAPSGAGEFVQAYTQLPVCLTNSFGVSAMLRTPDEYTTIDLKLDVYTGATLYRIHARLNYATGKVKVYNSAGAWQDVCSFLTEEGATTSFHMLKVCGDKTTGNYIRLLYDNNEYDLSGVAMSSAAAAVISKLICIVMVYGLVGSNSVVEVDDVIVTAKET